MLQQQTMLFELQIRGADSENQQIKIHREIPQQRSVMLGFNTKSNNHTTSTFSLHIGQLASLRSPCPQSLAAQPFGQFAHSICALHAPASRPG
jgi:hypothetical protein